MRRRFLIVLPVAGLTASLLHAQPGNANRGTAIGAGEQCPPGMTEVRPRNCQAPSAAPPSILDYRPRSTLVAPGRTVPKAKYPAIDFHGHPGAQLTSDAALTALGSQLDALNIRVMIAANNVSGDELVREMAVVRASPTMRDRVRILTGVSFRDVGPGWAEKAVAQLEKRCGGRRGRDRRDRQGPGPDDQEGRWHAPQDR